MSRTFLSISVKSVNSESSACVASSAFRACWLNCVKKMFFLGISDRRMRSLPFRTQKDRADGAVRVVRVMRARRHPAPGPRRVHTQTSFAEHCSRSESRTLARSGDSRDLSPDGGDRAGGHEDAE